MIAFAAATALLFAYRRIGQVALVFAVLIGASRVWVGVHYPHDVATGMAVGGCVALGLMVLVRRRARTLVRLMTATPLRPLLPAS